MDKEFSDNLVEGLVNLRRYIIKDKPHIKKYEKIRKIHQEIVDSMDDYLCEQINNGTKSREMAICLDNSGLYIPVDLDSENIDDKSILSEIFVYKVYPSLKSITEEYIEKHKFRNAAKIKMLYAMNNSVVGLFKVINIDFDNCYVTYEDVFTHKTYKIIDITFSTIYKNLYKEKNLYVYNRLISYESITFGTGMHIKINSDDKKFKNFLKKHNYNKYSDLYRCLYLYYL